MKLKVPLLWLLILVPCLHGIPLAAAEIVPSLINYQGKLVSSNGLPVSTGDYELRFRIYDAATAGNLVWGPQVFNGQSGRGHGAKVPVVQGWFNVILGPSDTNGISIASCFAGTNRFMDIQLGGTEPFTPRQQVLSVPYALRAENAGTVDGLRTTAPVTLYVSPAGSDANDGTTANRAKRTIQGAVNFLPRLIEHSIVIELAPGIYDESVQIIGKRTPHLDAVTFFIQGRGDPSGTVIRGSPPVLISGSFPRFRQVCFQSWTNATDPVGLRLNDRSMVFVEGCQFRSGSGIVIEDFSNAHIWDSIFEAAQPGSGNGVMVSGGSTLYFRDDGDNTAYPWNNSVKNYAQGVVATFGGLVFSSPEPTYVSNLVNSVTQWGGRYLTAQ